MFFLAIPHHGVGEDPNACRELSTNFTGCWFFVVHRPACHQRKTSRTSSICFLSLCSLSSSALVVRLKGFSFFTSKTLSLCRVHPHSKDAVETGRPEFECVTETMNEKIKVKIEERERATDGETVSARASAGIRFEKKKKKRYTFSGLCTERYCAGMYSVHSRVTVDNMYEFQHSSSRASCTF